MAIDFFTVPTVTFKVLFVFVVLAYRRREVLHFNVTEHPTAEWIARQLVEAVADRDSPRYLIRDRDRVYGRAVSENLASLNVQQVMTAPASPWQNGVIERLIGSIRRECLDHVIVFNRWRLKRILGPISPTTQTRERICHLRRTAQGPGKWKGREESSGRRRLADFTADMEGSRHNSASTYFGEGQY
jgi:transposase InsO family protein